MKQKRKRRSDKPIATNIMRKVSALNDAQLEAMQEYGQGQHIALLGSAGTGKSYLAIALGLEEILEAEGRCERLVIVRTLEPVKDIGFLPGTLEEKMAPYELPYVRLCDELFQYRKAYESLKQSGQVQFLPTSHVRGITLDNAVVIIDEIQSMTSHEMYSMLTRLGRNSKLIICGDGRQSDLRRGSCWSEMMQLLDNLSRVSVIEFTVDDIVRSAFVKEVIIEAERLGIT